MEQLNNFIKKISEKYPDAEITKILSENPDCGYYELCQSYLDIALNAPKFMKENGALAGSFQYSDIDIAKEITIDFINRNHVQDLHSFFDILNYAYPNSVSKDDKRQRVAYVKNDKCSYIGYAGTLYTFTQISPEVYQKIVKELIEEIRNYNAF